MTYEASRGVYRYIDEETHFPHQTSGHRAKQVLPRKNYDTAELDRQARHQEREEARRRSRTTNKATPDEIENDEEDIDGSDAVWPHRAKSRIEILHYKPSTQVTPLVTD